MAKTVCMNNPGQLLLQRPIQWKVRFLRFVLHCQMCCSLDCKEGSGLMAEGDLNVTCADGSAVSCNCWTAWTMEEVCGAGRGGKAKSPNQLREMNRNDE